LLADEVNRASPRTQSALLEAMEERQISVAGKTHALPEPFYVVATQNPKEQLGTYALPESQLDRFLMRVDLGYPDGSHERRLLREGDRREQLARIKPAFDGASVLKLQAEVRKVHVADSLLDYVQALLAHSRTRSDVRLGLSPRAGQGLIRAAQAWAMLQGSSSVMPEHVQAVFVPVAGHRLQRSVAGQGNGRELANDILRMVAIPT
jgi:MoxR-like ATPase